MTELTSATCFECSRKTIIHLKFPDSRNEWGLPAFLLCSLPYHHISVSLFQNVNNVWLLLQVNGVPVHTMQHSEVVAAIKAGGDETRLLVVDSETDAFFMSCGVLPTEKHLTGTSVIN